MVRPVAVGVDGSPESLAAAEWAADEAALRGLALRIVYAREWRTSSQQFSAGVSAQLEWVESRIRTAASAARERHPELAITADETSELPARTLLDAALESEFLVLGSRGLGALRGFLVGSVGLAVIAHAGRPVVVVRGEPKPAFERRRLVVLGLDVHHDCEPLAEFAFEAAAVRDAALRVVHVWGREESRTYLPEAPDHEGEARQALRDALGPCREKFPDTEVDERLGAGSTAQLLVAAAEDAELLVVGRRKRGLMGSHLGPVTHAVLHHVACPVAVVPHD